MLSRYERLILDHPVLVLIGSVIATVFFGYLASGLHFSSSTEKFFVSGDPAKEDFEKAKQYFGNDQVMVIALVVPEGETIYTRERLQKLKEVTEKIVTIDGIDKSVSLVNVPAIHAPRDPETGEYQKRIEIKNLVGEIPADNDYDGRQWRAIFEDLNRIPLYEGNLVSRARRDDQGRIIPYGVRAAAILAFVDDFKEQTHRYREVVGELKEMLAVYEGPDKFYLAGIPLTKVETEARMIEDLKTLVPLTLLVIALLLVISFRNARGVVLPLVAIMTITVWTMGFMQLVGIPITLVTMILPPLMLALGSSYSIHMMSEYLSQADEGLSVREVVKQCLLKVTLPVVVCGFTTIVGFASLAVNRIPAIQDLGYAAVVGIFISVVVVLFVVPASLMLIKKPGGEERKKEKKGAVESLLLRLARFNIDHRKNVFRAALALTAASFLGISMIEINTDFLSFFDEDDPVRVAANVQAEHLAGAAPFNIVFEADRADAFKHPAMLKRIEALQQWSQDPANVDGIDTTVSIADFVKLFYQAFKQNDPEYRRIADTPAELTPILDFLPTKDFAQYVTTDYSAANVLIRSRLVGSGETGKAIGKIEDRARLLFKAPERRPLVDQDPKAHSPVPMVGFGEDGVSDDGEEDVGWIEDGDDDGGEEDVGWIEDAGEEAASDAGDGATALDEAPALADAPVEEDLLPYPPEDEFPWPHVKVYVTGTIHLLNKSADAVSRGQVTGLAMALVAIFVVMSLLFLSPRIGLLAMLPNLFPIFILFGLMGFTGITLNFSTSLIAAIALGIGVDDTIHYINRYNQEVQATRDQNEAMVKALVSIGRPMIYTSVALFFGFLIFVSSDFVPIRQFGFLTAITLMVALVSNLVILPSLMISVSIVTLWDLLDLAIGDNPAHYIKIFHGLGNNQAKLAVLMGYVEDYKDRDWIFRDRELGSEMYVVLTGYVDIIKGEGDDEVVLATTQPGDAFGEMALLRHTYRTAAARAQGEVKLFVIDEQMLLRLARRYPKISSTIYCNIAQMLSDRLQTANLQVYECSLDLKEFQGEEKSDNRD